MTNCFQTFQKEFKDLAKDTEGKNLFGVFSNEDTLNIAVSHLFDESKNKADKSDSPEDALTREEAIQLVRENAKSNIAEEVFKNSFSANETCLSYNFNKVIDTLKKINSQFPINTKLSSEDMEDILNNLKHEIIKYNDLLDTNPTIWDNEGNITQLFDFKNLSELTSGVESLEKFISNELESGFLKVIFINNLAPIPDSEMEYEPFVVTETALNHNILVYKNELWSYALRASHLVFPTLKNRNLYINGKINNDLFLIDNTKGLSPYAEVLHTLKNDMSNIFNKSNPEKFINLSSTETKSTAQGYLKALILANFDNFIINKHHDIIKVNSDSSNSFGTPMNEKSKYQFSREILKTGINHDEKVSGIDEHTTSLVKRLSNVIPFWELNENGKWVENPYFTVGKANLDALGAILNDINPTLKLVRFNSNNEIEDYTLPLNQAFKQYDTGNLSFQSILGSEKYGLIAAVADERSLETKEAILRSLQSFLYGKRGIHKTFEEWQLSNNDIADLVVNPEIAIINHLRNTVKVKYRIGNRTVDALDIDYAIGGIFKELISNVTKAWTSKRITDADFDAVKDDDSFFNFLTNPLKGGLTLSKLVKSKLTQLKLNYTSPNFIRTLKLLQPDNYNFTKTVIGNDGTEINSTRDSEDILDALLSPETNNVLKLIDLFKSQYSGQKFNIVSTIQDSKGNSMATMSIANPASLINISLASAPEDDFFKENSKLLSGVEILSEVENNNVYKEVTDLNHVELFKYNFLTNYLMSIINENKWLIQPWDYSDKSKVFGLAIQSNVQLKQENSNLGELQKLNSTILKNEFYRRQQKYYNMLVSKIYNDYLDLDPKYFTNPKIKTSIDKLNHIDLYLQTLKTDTTSARTELANRINKIFQQNKYVEMVDELHYSTYKNDELRVNQLLKSNVLIFNNPKYFDTYVQAKESNLVDFIKANKIEFNLDNIKSADNKPFSAQKKKKAIQDIFQLEGNQVFPTLLKEESKQILLYNTENNTISELLSRYLWGRNLLISQYANLTTKDTFLHPIKENFQEINFEDPNWVNNYTKEETARSIVFTKRMNMPGASMSIYGRGLIGIPTEIKVAIVAKPNAEVYNTIGQSKMIDTMDGGGKVSSIFNELLNWSLPGFDLQTTQKPIGESINNKFATSLKFATFALTNEEIRLSPFAENSAYNMMKKMHQFDLYDGNYQNLLATKDATGQEETFSINTAFPNLWIPINGTHYKFINLKYLGKADYQIIYEDQKGIVQNTKPITINNLFDLWEAFGGAYSASMKDNVLEFNEDSIKIVASIVKKHALSNSLLDLKDKMIAMLLPPSAVKKGAANVNSLDHLLTSENKLSWFKFNTSFLGIQLDPAHSTEDSTVNEITQVMSAIAENSSTPELYNAVYDTIANVIQTSLKRFKSIITEPNNIIKIEKVNNIIQSFIKNLNNSTQINNARVILNGIEDNLSEIIPLSNKTLYKQFISFAVSNINSEFIRRKFSGTASTLMPSQGIITVFESNNGTVYTAPDLLKLANQSLDINKIEVFNQINNSNISEFEKNQQKIQWALNTFLEFKSTPINIRAVEPLDNISLSEDITFANKFYPKGSIISLNKIEDFFSFKDAIEKIPNVTIDKIFTQSRDLRPQIVRFTQLIDNIKTNRTIFDTDAVKFAWWLTKNEESLILTKFRSENTMFNNFQNYIAENNLDYNTLTDPKIKFKFLSEYSKRWVMRTHDLLAYKKTFTSYDTVAEQNLDINPFNKLFEYNFNGKTYIDKFITRYEPENIYTYETPILTYLVKKAENIHTNVHKANFNIANESRALISREGFEKNLKTFINRSRPVPKSQYDVIFSNPNTQYSIYIAIDGQRYIERNGKLIDTLIKLSPHDDPTKQEVGNLIFVNQDKLDTGEIIRRDYSGNKLYTLPENYSIFKDKAGNEILLIKSSRDPKTNEIISSLTNTGDFVKQLSSYSIIRFNDFNNYLNNIKSNENSDTLLQLIKTLKNSINIKYLRDYLDIKQNNYLTIKNKLQDLSDISIRNEYSKYLNTVDKTALFDYVNKLSNVLMTSFEYSNYSLASRIPAQAMQSFQSMNTIAYLSGDDNNIYVSHWQLWLQGSDFDIDKIYLMMYDFKNGIFSGWSPYFNMSNIVTAEKSFQLPLPTGDLYYSSTAKDVPEKIDRPNLDNTFDIRPYTQGSGSSLDKLVLILNKLKNQKNIIYLQDNEDNNMIQKINRHNKFKSSSGFKNYMIMNLLETSDNPKNHVASYSPISFGDYEDIKSSLAKSNTNKEILSLYDGHSMFKQQENNAIGKAVIGIAATGLKNYFALIKYYADYYNSPTEKTNLDNAFFYKELNLGDQNVILTKIAGLNLNDKAFELLKSNLTTNFSTGIFKKKDGSNYSEDEIKYLINQISRPDVDAALIISSILSLATDNAKELMLAKINAGVDFAGMHIYLAIMGLDAHTIASYMTSPDVLKIKQAISQDFFTNTKEISVITSLNKLLKSHNQDEKSTFNQYISAIKNGNEALAKSLYNDNIENWEKEDLNPLTTYNFLHIYNLASELTSLGSLLKVNQGIEATQESIYNFSEQLTKILAIKNQVYFSDLKDNSGNGVNASIDARTNYIITEKPYLYAKYPDVRIILEKADALGISKTGIIDAQRYFIDPNYRDTITSYYNLIKGTFNIFDILNHLPHFHAMYDSLIAGETFILDTVNKYKVIKETIPNVINEDMSDNPIVPLGTAAINQETRIFNSKNMPIYFSEALLSKINDWYDNVTISKFIKGLDLKLSINDLLDYLEIPQITLMQDSKTEVLTSIYKKDAFNNFVDPIKVTSNPIIDLSTEYGLAQFKFLMENDIIPHLKLKSPENGFLKAYIFSRYKNYNLRNQIAFYTDPSNLNELNNVEVGMAQLIRSEGKLFNPPIKVVGNNLESIRAVDLLYLYDLITNEGKFGGNRATIFFSKDIKNESSFSRQFIEFQRKVDSDSNYLNQIKTELATDPNFRKAMYLKLFGTVDTHTGARQVILKEVRDFDGQIVPDLPLVIANPYYTLIESTGGAAYGKSIDPISYLTDSIKNGRGQLKINCDGM